MTGVGGTSLSAVGPPPYRDASGTAAGTPRSGGGVRRDGGGDARSFWATAQLPVGGVSSSLQSGEAVHGGCGARPAARCPTSPPTPTSYTGYSGLLQPAAGSIFGGTSAAAPTWAALAALANAVGGVQRQRPVGFANPALYAAGAQRLRQRTSTTSPPGNNVLRRASRGFYRRHRLRHGLRAGLAQGRSRRRRPLRLHLDPAGSAARARPGPHAPAPAGRDADPPRRRRPPASASAVRLALHATDSAGQGLTYRATGLPASLSVATSTGLITGSPSRAGKSSATITVTDTSARPRRRPWPGSSPPPTITGGLSVNAQAARRWRSGGRREQRAGDPVDRCRPLAPDPLRQANPRPLAADHRAQQLGPSPQSAAKLRRGDLVVTLRSSAVRSASLRVTVPAITLIKAKKPSRKHHGAAVLQSLTVTVTDVLSFRTAFSVR